MCHPLCYTDEAASLCQMEKDEIQYLVTDIFGGVKEPRLVGWPLGRHETVC